MYKRQVSVDDLRLGMYVIELDRPWTETPFKFQQFYLDSQDQIETLRTYCKQVYVDADRNRESVENELAAASATFESCKIAVRDTLESLRREAKMDASKLAAATSEMTQSMQRNPNAMLLLNGLQTKSEYELRRAVDSSVLMIAFGRFLQFARDRLELLGLAGILLDIGKVGIPAEILHKKGPLTGEEFELVKSHVTRSVELVRAANGNLPRGVEEIIIQHHERRDGTGYPNGLKGDEISMEGSIAGIADSFSALTTERSFAEPISPSTALSQLYAMRATFHEALIEQFIQCMGIYPVGSAVEMSTGEVGVVMAQNAVRRLLPRVMLVLDPDWKPLPHPQIILDLMREPKTPVGDTYRIRRTIPMEKLPIDPNEFFLPWLDPEAGRRAGDVRRT